MQATQQVFADERPADVAGFNVTGISNYTISSVLTNPIDLINKFAEFDTFRAYIAANITTNAIGYSVLNAKLWEHRKNRKTAATRAMIDECFGIDGFNEEKAEETLLPADWLGLENGLATLPRMNSLKLLGVYKQLLREQLSDQYAKDMPPSMPQEIIATLHGRKPKNIDAQSEFVRKAIEASGLPLKQLQEQQEAAQQRQNDQNARQHAAERDFLIGEFKTAIPELFSNEHWQEIPLYVQYRYVFNIYKQVMKSVAKASVDVTEERPDALETFDAGLELAKSIHAELKAVEKHPQITLAFEQNVLDPIKYGLE